MLAALPRYMAASTRRALFAVGVVLLALLGVVATLGTPSTSTATSVGRCRLIRVEISVERAWIQRLKL